MLSDANRNTDKIHTKQITAYVDCMQQIGLVIVLALRETVTMYLPVT